MLRLIPSIKRNVYPRSYMVSLVFNDGSSITTRYHEPRKVIKVPLTIEECKNEVEKEAWIGRRRSTQTGEVEKTQNLIKYDPRKYLRKR